MKDHLARNGLDVRFYDAGYGSWNGFKYTMRIPHGIGTL
jgi:hypothetical protein